MVEPALRAALAGGGEQLHGLGALAAQQPPQLGVADVERAVEALEAGRGGDDDVALLAGNPRWSRRARELRGRDRRAAGGEREQAGADALGQPGDREAARPAAPCPGRALEPRSASIGSRSSSRSSLPEPVTADGRRTAPGRSARPCAGRARTRAARRSGRAAASASGRRRTSASWSTRSTPCVEVLARARPVGAGAVVRALTAIALTREVAAREVLRDRRAELDLRQRARPRVALAARAREVEGELAGAHRRGAEALVDGQRAADALGGTPRDGDARRPRRPGRARAARGPAARRGPRRRPRARPARPPRPPARCRLLGPRGEGPCRHCSVNAVRLPCFDS